MLRHRKVCSGRRPPNGSLHSSRQGDGAPALPTGSAGALHWGERRYELYVRVASADGISQGTPVVIEGLDVGQVTSISPRVDSATRRISFVAKMSVKERFEDGSSPQLPLGTRAELVQTSQISAAIAIRLILPDTVRAQRTYLHAGDTVDSRRRGSALEAVAEVADELSQRVQEMVRTATRTLVRLQSTLRDVTPDVERTLNGVKPLPPIQRDSARADSGHGPVGSKP